MAKKKIDPPSKKGTAAKDSISYANRRAPLMNVDLGKGRKMSIDTTSMKNPDPKTFSFVITAPDGSVVRKGKLTEGGFGAANAKEIIKKWSKGLK